MKIKIKGLLIRDKIQVFRAPDKRATKIEVFHNRVFNNKVSSGGRGRVRGGGEGGPGIRDKTVKVLRVPDKIE